MNTDSAEERQAFKKMFSTVWALYSKNITKEVLTIYLASLKRFTLDEIRHALNVHVQNPDAGQYLPKPADLIRILEGASETTAMQAWSKVEKAIRSVGPYESVVFDDPIIHCVIVDMGGWIEMNKIMEDELPFKAREFEKRYQGYVLKKSEAHPRMLMGIAQADAERRGYKINPPVLIGNQQKAEATFRLGSEQSGVQITHSKSISDLLRLDRLPKKAV
ncbi:MAG: hypothetical protein KME67_05095 [Candidatus Thiodiazotropha sp. (ex Codakia orbicularis)]|nr:hypothetical protein [Candidatus Thiodiazotropha sp. (ex Codakia orbicularis)]